MRKGYRVKVTLKNWDFSCPVPSGASALLGAFPSEPLSVAVARMVFRRMLAPGLIVTSTRYVR